MKIWFMFDNHCFQKVSMEDRESIIRQASDLFREDGCGSLFVKDQWDSSLNSLCLHGRELKKGDRDCIHRVASKWGITQAELETWADAVVAEASFQKLMCG